MKIRVGQCGKRVYSRKDGQHVADGEEDDQQT